MKYTATALIKTEKILAEAGYVIRYERGNFQSGYCILEDRKIIVLNKFLSIEGRINTIVDLVPQIQINYDQLTLESQKLYDSIMKKSAVADQATTEEDLFKDQLL